MKISRLLLWAVTLAMVTACGGGGSSSDNVSEPPVQQLPFSMSVTSGINQMQENESQSITLSYLNPKGAVALSVDSYNSDIPSTSYTVTADDGNKAITVTVNELTYDGTVNFVVTGTDSNGKTDSESISFPVSNPSALPKLEALDSIKSALPNILSAVQERSVLNALTELSRLTGDISEQEASTRISSVDSTFDIDKKSTIQTYVTNANWHEAYNNGDMDENTIDDAVSYLTDELNAYLTGINELLSMSQNDLTTAYLPDLPIGNFYISDDGVVSQFWGNPSMGSVNSEAVWQFNESYAFLTALIFPEIQTCNSQQ
jgi:hypothetical protein